MSSKKFLALHDPASPSMKKIASSGAIPISTGTPESDQEEDDENRASPTDPWNLIQSQKPLIPTAPTYVHPLMSRSSRSLSSKSLELCTESLGSETGSEFSSPPSPAASFLSSFPPSPPDVMEEEGSEDGSVDFLFDGEADRRKNMREIDEENCVNYNCTTTRRSPARLFPPPLPSISRRDGPRLQMKPYRQDGRLVLQAVAVPSHNYLQAQRQGGRLLLSFIPTHQQRKEETEEEEEEDEAAAEEEGDAEIIKEDVEEQGEEEPEGNIVNGEGAEEAEEEVPEGGDEEAEEDMEKRLEMVNMEGWRSRGPAVMELHRSIGKLISQPFMNINPWAQKKKLAADATLAERQREMAAQRLNRYERCWRRGGLGGGSVVGAKGSVGGLVPRRCREPRRTHPVWVLERHCVATT
ncbi:unnamed protein product [Victoria cruziana]